MQWQTRLNIFCAVHNYFCTTLICIVLNIRFDFVVTPLVHPRYTREYLGATPPHPGPLTRSDKVIKVSEWGTLIVAKLSPWIQLDSENDVIRRNSEKVCVCK